MIIEKKFCSICGEKFTKPIQHFLKPDEIDIKVVCSNCLSKTGDTNLNSSPFYSHTKNLEKWK